MAWVKRNLFFVIGASVALLLMGAAGWFLYSKWALNGEILAKLDQDYAELKQLAAEKPHPGSGQVDNIKLAKEQQQQLRGLIQKARDHFQKIAPIPEEKKVTDQSLSSALSHTIAKLQQDATNSSVALPANYSFSFEAQKQKVSFASGSTEPLAVQLGEIKTFCDVLFQAKVNSLDGIRRERVSMDDNSGPISDYLGERTVTNELALLTPYELTFKCFSSELAAVLQGFANSPYSIVVKTVNVELAPAVTVEPTPAAVPQTQVYTSQPQPVAPRNQDVDAARAFQSRYGVPMQGDGYRPRPVQPVYAAPQPTAPAPTGKGGLPTVLDEKQLKVTMHLVLIKMQPSKDK